MKPVTTVAARTSPRAKVHARRPTIGVLHAWEIQTGVDSYLEALVVAEFVSVFVAVT